MKVSFLVAGLSLWMLCGLAAAGLAGDPGCHDSASIRSDCSQCANSNDCRQIDSTSVCCNISIATGGISECAGRFARYSIDLQNACLTTPLQMLILGVTVDLSSSPISNYVCPAYDIAIECIRTWYGDALGLTDGTCSLGDFHGLFIEQMKMAYMAVTGLSATPDIFMECDGAFNTTIECVDQTRARAAILAHCGLQAFALMQAGMKNLTCLTFGSCFEGVKSGYRAVYPSCYLEIENVFGGMIDNSEGIEVFKNITGFNVSECNECILNASWAQDTIGSCLSMPLYLLNATMHFDLNDPLPNTLVCQTYNTSIACIKATVGTELKLDAGCSLRYVFHPFFVQLLQYGVMGTPGLQNDASIFNQCEGELADITPQSCPDFSHARAAVMAYCSKAVIEAPPGLGCFYIEACINNMTSIYRESYPLCDIDGTFEAVTTSPQEISTFYQLTGFNVTSCTDDDDDSVYDDPDIVCRNVTLLLAAVFTDVASSCQDKFLAILFDQDLDSFCRNLWIGLSCTAEMIFKDEEDDIPICISKMKETIDSDPNAILEAMERQLGSLVPDNVRAFAPQANTCPVPEFGDDDDDDDDDDKMEIPVPAELRNCANLTRVQAVVQPCVTMSFNTTTDAECRRFHSAVRCVARSLLDMPPAAGAYYTYMFEKCQDLVVKTMNKSQKALAQVIGRLVPDHCKKLAEVCGDGMLPLVNHSCQNCPNSYTCVLKQYCCPVKKPGMCPMTGNALCSRTMECNMDSDCMGNMKCCDQGCGSYKICVMPEDRMKSVCERKFDVVKERLYQQGACGSGTGMMPQCQGTKFSPIQGDMTTGVMHCVTEDGMKIPGSEFRGNKDCPTTLPGKCPAMPAMCINKSPEEVALFCMSDDDCGRGEKCCYVASGSACTKQCATASNLNGTDSVQVCPNGETPSCCPTDICHGKICHAMPAAVCRPNPCGGCSVEFFDGHNNKVNCTEGLSVCQHRRAMARMMNNQMSKNYSSNLLQFVRSHQLYSDDMMGYGDKMNLEERRLDLSNMMGDGMMGYDMDDMMYMMDKYGDMVRKAHEMEKDSRLLEIEIAYFRGSPTFGILVQQMCQEFDRYGICGMGSCAIGAGTYGYLQLCNCPPGYYGLFCDKVGVLSPDTTCTRYKDITDGIWERVMNNDAQGRLVHRLLTVFRIDYDIMPRTMCDAMGYFMDKQQGVFLPVRPDGMIIEFCVNKETGQRIPYTMIVPAGEDLNCTHLAAPDVLTLPGGCHLQPGNNSCKAGDHCQYYFNSLTEKCEMSSRVGYGFDTPSQCYGECGLQVLSQCPPLDTLFNRETDACPSPCDGSMSSCPEYHVCCPSECGGYGCKLFIELPQPCRSLPCNFETEFCLVTETAGGQIGECKSFKPYCMQPMDPGYGNMMIGSYYFDMNVRRCRKFTYYGYGGNWNWFSNLHQCQSECGVYADYKYDYPVCPPVIKLAHMTGDMYHECNSDYDCMEHQVCCSNGRSTICTYPVGTCGTQRCSPEARCVNDTCVCPTCENEASNMVCGSNHERYENLCMLKKDACEKMINITVMSCDDMTITGDEMMMGDCPGLCTLQYDPVCAQEKSSNGAVSLVTFSNRCALREAIRCENRQLHVVYETACEDRACPKPDGNLCELYQTCVAGVCTCQTVCTAEFAPVCAYPENLPTNRKTFGNACAMRNTACQEGVMYIIESEGSCQEAVPEYGCPATRSNIPYSAVYRCHPETHAYCGEDSMCCPYGAGYSCIPKKYLRKGVMKKAGFCPILSYVNFDRDQCFKKEIMCEDDSDGAGDLKCCDNMVCGHKTLTHPIGLDASPCGANMQLIPGLTCDPDMTDSCPIESSSICTPVTMDGWSMNVCCMPGPTDPARDDMEIYGSKLCGILDRLGLNCQNGGSCIGDVHGARMCQCQEGYYGAFCDKMSFNYTCDNPVNCLTNPCDNAECSLEGVECIENYCGGCNTQWKYTKSGRDATPFCIESKCHRLKEIMTRVFALVPPGDENEMEEEEDEEEDQTDGYLRAIGTQAYNPDIIDLGHVMVSMGFDYVPLMGDVNCTSDGYFRQSQCFQSTLEGESKSFCTCVHMKTGEMIKNAPIADDADDLDCNFVTSPDFPPSCLEVPSNASCGGHSKRYHYSPSHRQCVPYMDGGCDDSFRNSFATMEDCKSKCSSKFVFAKRCETVRCPGGTVCQENGDTVECVDVTRVVTNDKYMEPDCEENGDFSPRQCYGNLCFCVDRDGMQVTNSYGTGQTLDCTRDEMGNTMADVPQPAQQIGCPNGGELRICMEPGQDPCNDCNPLPDDGMGNNMSNNMTEMYMRDPHVDENGECTNCQSCPAGQGGVECKVSCAQSECPRFKMAECRVDPCTCTIRHYKSNNQEVNCNAYQNECEQEKLYYEGLNSVQMFQERAMGMMPNSSPVQAVVVKCAADGSYQTRCVGPGCVCLNAVTGLEVGEYQTGFTIDTLDCSVTRQQTLALKANVRVKISDRQLSSISQADVPVIVQRVTMIYKNRGVDVTGAKLMAGSVNYVGTAEVDVSSNVQSETGNLASLLNAVHGDIEGETIEVNNQMYILGTPTIDEYLEEDDIPTTTARPVDDDDEDNTGLIIGIVVGVVALLLIIVAVVVIVSRNKSKKSSSMQFSDLRGKDNPMYHNKA